MNAVTPVKAALYHRYRLPHPAAPAAAVLRHTGPAGAVADSGAGTGQLARRSFTSLRRETSLTGAASASTREGITLDRNHTQRRALTHQWATGLSLSGAGGDYTTRRAPVSAAEHGARHQGLLSVTVPTQRDGTGAA